MAKTSRNLDKNFEPIREEESQMRDSDNNLYESKDREEEEEIEEEMEDNSGMEQITPF